ncbi:alpha/beta hydrolase family protein [Ceratobasidium sp. AG-Ba]|nr:alpha/beta hydrolase family protein [Ceratobasidium sp. AG-Ba]
MVFSSTLLAGITLATAASAAPLSSLGARAFGPRPSASPTSYGTCTQQMMPVTVNAEYTKINIRKPTDQATLTGFLANWWATGSTVAQQSMPPNSDGSRPRTAKKSTYNVFTQMCYPNNWKDGGVAFIGTHGINFDHSYWEFGYSKEYNFIEAATKAGYAVFTHDRLGVGQSDKPDGLSETQAWTEVEIMHQLIQNLRKSGKFSKLIGIGHSFGSVQLTGIANKYPEDLNAVVLTGYTPSLVTVPLSFTGWAVTLAKEQPDASIRSRWLSLPGGQKYNSDLTYWGTGSASADRFAFFAEGSYDEGAFQQAYNTKQTFTMGEFMTIGEPISQIAPDYKGDVFVVTGEKDLIFCGGNCNQKPTKVEGNSLLDDTKTYFPNSKSFNTYVPPGAGHALFTHHGTDVTMSKIMEWAGRV